MSSFKQISDSIQGLRQSEIAEGVFFKPVTLRTLQRIQEAAGIDTDGEDTDTATQNERLRNQMLLLFQEVFCDADGNPFEDINSAEDIDDLNISVLIDVSREVHGHLAMGKED